MTDDGWVKRGVRQGRALLDGGPWEVTTLPGTGGGQFGSSVARLRSSTDSAIVKVIRRNDAGPTDPASWRRELDLYRFGWLAEALPGSLTLPKCRGWTVDESAAVIVLEDVPFDDREARSLDWYGRLAERVALLTATPVYDVPACSSRGFVASEAAKLQAATAHMTAAPSPYITRLVDEWRPLLQHLLVVLPTLLARLDETPQAFNHLDVFSRNAAEVGDLTVLIDWAYAGLAPIGTDAAGIVAMTGMHGDVTADQTEGLYWSVVDGFVAGLSAVGQNRNPIEVMMSIDILLTLRWVRFLTTMQGAGDGVVAIAETVVGRPLEQVLAAWGALSTFVLTRAEVALGTVEP